MSSPAFAEAIKWLAGQMPQMREVRPGISHTSRPSQNFSKPRNSFTWNLASTTRPFSSSRIVILACPSIRVTGSMTIVRVSLVLSIAQVYIREFGYPPLQQRVDGEPDLFRSRRTAVQKRVDGDHFMQRSCSVRKRADNRRWHRRSARSELDIRTLHEIVDREAVAESRYVACGCTIAERNDTPAARPNQTRHMFVLFAGHRPLDERNVDIRRIFLYIGDRREDQFHAVR